jgi:hypothetical protein
LLFSRTAASFFIPAIFHVMQKFYKKKNMIKKNWTFFLVLYYFQCPQWYFILFYFILFYVGQDSFKVTINSIVLFEFLPIGFLPLKKHKSEINTLVPWYLFLTQKKFILFVEMLKWSFFNWKNWKKKHNFFKNKDKKIASENIKIFRKNQVYSGM